MNIVFLSESNIRGKVERTFENSRTEFGWSIALDAEWLPITENTTKKYDLGIVIIPKNNPNVDLDRIRNFAQFIDTCSVTSDDYKKTAKYAKKGTWFYADPPYRASKGTFCGFLRLCCRKSRSFRYRNRHRS